GMVSFIHADGEEGALQVCSRTRLFTLAESLGGVESLIEHPGRMTHASTAGSMLQVPVDLVRLSVGIEDAADLVVDLLSALGCPTVPGCRPAWRCAPPDAAPRDLPYFSCSLPPTPLIRRTTIL